uniref:DprA-like winged helix domain-containing protein n=1 Tax=Candidatus Limisoma sp. TaxID=3076476 RepID=UPI003FEF326F
MAVVDGLQGRELGQINELSALLKMPVHKLLSVLFELEFKGAVSVMPGNCYRLV